MNSFRHRHFLIIIKGRIETHQPHQVLHQRKKYKSVVLLFVCDLQTFLLHELLLRIHRILLQTPCWKGLPCPFQSLQDLLYSYPEDHRSRSCRTCVCVQDLLGVSRHLQPFQIFPLPVGLLDFYQGGIFLISYWMPFLSNPPSHFYLLLTLYKDLWFFPLFQSPAMPK